MYFQLRPMHVNILNVFLLKWNGLINVALQRLEQKRGIYGGPGQMVMVQDRHN